MARLIDADALKKRFKKYVDYGECKVFELWEINEAIDRRPTVEVRNNEAILHGRWEEFEFEYADREYVGYKCSECDSRCLTTDFGKYKYCPYCGARMEDERWI